MEERGRLKDVSTALRGGDQSGALLPARGTMRVRARTLAARNVVTRMIGGGMTL